MNQSLVKVELARPHAKHAADDGLRAALGDGVGDGDVAGGYEGKGAAMGLGDVVRADAQIAAETEHLGGHGACGVADKANQARLRHTPPYPQGGAGTTAELGDHLSGWGAGATGEAIVAVAVGGNAGALISWENYSPGNMEHAPSRGHGASPQIGLGVGCKTRPPRFPWQRLCCRLWMPLAMIAPRGCCRACPAC